MSIRASMDRAGQSTDRWIHEFTSTFGEAFVLAGCCPRADPVMLLSRVIGNAQNRHGSLQIGTRLESNWRAAGMTFQAAWRWRSLSRDRCRCDFRAFGRIRARIDRSDALAPASSLPDPAMIDTANRDAKSGDREIAVWDRPTGDARGEARERERPATRARSVLSVQMGCQRVSINSNRRVKSRRGMSIKVQR
jgi:hypothetical protein